MSRMILSLKSPAKHLTYKFNHIFSKNVRYMSSITCQSGIHNINKKTRIYSNQLYNHLICNFSETKINEDSASGNCAQNKNETNVPQNENEEDVENNDNSESEYETDEDHDEQIEELKQQIQDLETDRDKFRNSLARLQADFVNYERMAAKDVQQAKDFAVKKFSSDVLSVADAIESCMKLFDNNQRFHLDFENEEHKDIKQIYDGILLTHKALLDSFKRNGIEQFESLNQQFDPNKHEALFNIPATNEEDSNKVLQVVSEGYTINDHILRPAKVGVATKQ